MEDYISLYAGAEIDEAVEKTQTIDQVFTDAEKTKLLGIETGATADLTGAEIKSLYEAELDTNSFTDVEKTKLLGIEVGAEVNNISDINVTDLTDSGDSELHYHSIDRDRSNHTGTQSADTITDGATNKVFTTTEKTKLSGIEDNADVNTINSKPIGITGADQITNIVSLTQAEYDAIVTPDANTVYIVRA